MKAASAAHKPSLTKSPEGTKSSPTHALRAASAAERESSLQKAPSPPPSRTSEEASRINQLARQLAEAELYSTGGISKSDLTRAASLSMAKKQASDKAEQNAALQRRKLVEQEAKEEWTQHQEVEDAARRIVAERLAQVTLTGEEGDEYLAGKAAEDAIHRGDKRVKDWERVLKKLEQENKQDKEKNVGWLRHSMRQSPSEPTRQDPEQIIEAAKRNVKSQLGEMDRSIAQEHLFLGKHTVEQAAKRDAATKELEEKGAADLETRQKQRASMLLCIDSSNVGTYDIGGIIMTHEQVEAIAQKHVDEVLAEINEKVEREKERLRLIAEEKRAKEEAKAAEKKRKADEKAAQKELKTVTKEQLAIGEGLAQYDAQKDKEAEAARKSHEKQARKELKEAGKDLGAAVGGVMEFDKHREEEDAYRNHMEELHRQRTLEEAEKDQAAAVGGVIQYDHEKDEEAARKEAVERHKANVELKKATAQQAQAAEVVLHPDTALDDDSKRHKFKSWLKDTKDKVARRLSVSKENYESSTTSPVKKESKIDDDEDIYGTQPLASTNWSTADKPEDESAKEAASSTPGQSERPATAESPEKPAVREINDLTAYKSAGYVEPGASEDDHFDDAAEEIDEEPTASSSLAVKGEEGRKMSSERGSRFKEEF